MNPIGCCMPMCLLHCTSRFNHLAFVHNGTLVVCSALLQALYMPIEVDVLLVGFDGDGGYGYNISTTELEELLGASAGVCGVISANYRSPTFESQF
jgi:hypothetical protein